MAVDGSVVLSADMNINDAEKKLKKLASDVEKTEQSISEYQKKRDESRGKSTILGAQIEEEHKKLEEIKQTIQEINDIKKDKTISPSVREEASIDLDRAKQEYAEQNSRVKALEAEWKKLENSVDQYDAKIADANYKLEQQKTAAGILVQEIDAEKQARAEIARNAEVSDQHIIDLNREILELVKQRKELESKGIGFGYAEYDGISARIAKINSELKKYQQNLLQSANGVEDMADATKKADGYMGRFLTRIKGLLSRVFVFTMITSALRGLRTWLGKVVQTNSGATAALAKLKAALLTLAQPIVEVLIPAFTALINLLARLVTTVAKFVSALFGKTLEQSRDAAKSLYEEANALDAVGSAADDAAGSLAGFDEINTIGTENAGASGAASSGTAPDFESVVSSGLDSIIQVITGIALLALGAVLTFTGANPLLGLALMAAGAAFLVHAVATDPELLAAMVSYGLDLALQVIGPMLAVIGVLLAVTGNVLLGIALIIAGIALFEVGAAAGEDGDFAENIRARLSEAAMAIGILIGVVGLLLIVTGNIVLGLGLLIAGIALFQAGQVADDDGMTLKEKILNVFIRTAEIVGPFLAIIGLIFLFTGNVILGLALLTAGIALFSAGKAAYDDGMTIKEKVLKVLSDTFDIVSPFMAIAGLILLFTGQILLGLALLVAGIALFEAGQVADDEGMTVQQKVETVLKNTFTIVGPFMAIVGVILLFTGQILLGLALVVSGIALFQAGQVVDDEGMSITQKVTTILKNTFAIVGPFMAILGVILLFVGQILPGLALLIAGFALFGASLVADDEGMSITQKIQTVFSQTMLIVGSFLVVLGIILLFTGAGTALGLGLLVTGAVGLALAIVPNWDFILDAVRDAWGNLQTWWEQNAAKFFTVDYWLDLGKGMVTGLLNGLKSIFSGLAGWASNVWGTITSTFSSNNARSSISSSAASPAAASYSAPARVASMPSGYSIPYLAQGAVIPPNREFMAVLGDQSNGNNLEAPESLLRQIVREESSGGNTDLLQAILEAIRAGHIIMVDRRVLGQVVTQEQNRMTRQSGRSVVLG